MSRIIEWLRTRTNGKFPGISSRLTHLVETLAVAGSYIITIQILSFRIEDFEINWIYVLYGILVFLSRLALSRLTTLAIIPRTLRDRITFIRFLQVSFIEFFICTIIWIAIGLYSIHFILVPLYWITCFIFTFIIRRLSYRIFRHYRAKGYNTRYLLVFADQFSDWIIDKLIEQKEWGFQVKYILSNSKLIKNKYGERAKVLCENADLRFLLDCDVIDEVVYCMNKIENKQMLDIIKICEEVGVLFRMQSNLSPIKPVKLQLQIINMSNSIQLVDTSSNSFGIIMKNIADIYISTIALLLLSPILLLIAVIIKLDTKGPVLFIQERIGLRGRKFKLFKFRTMVKNAESIKHILKKQNEADGPVFKIKADPRVTRTGRILRKTGFDELPQLLNVIKGEMSLIGPRPPVAQEVGQYERWQLRRLSVKPGITCTWQVLKDRNAVPFEKWMYLDLDYIDNWTIMKDVNLFFKTFQTVVKATGH